MPDLVYSPRTTRGSRHPRDLGTPLLIHQPSYSMFNRWIEEGLLGAAGTSALGCIAFSPLAQGLLTDRYLNGIPPIRGAAQGQVARFGSIDETALRSARALHEIAGTRAGRC